MKIYYSDPFALLKDYVRKIIHFAFMSSLASRALFSLILTGLLVTLLSGCAGPPAYKGRDFSHTSIQRVLYNDDHNSEGFLAPLDNGKVLLIFRLDPGMEGNHSSSTGFIARITYDPERDEWGNVQTIYNSYQYDDRNIHGGVTRDGRVVFFSRRAGYDEEYRRITDGYYFMYSDDNGDTWEGPLTSRTWRYRNDARWSVPFEGKLMT